MKSAFGPTGPPAPVALRTGGFVHASRHYLIAFAVMGVVYLLYALLLHFTTTHDRYGTIGVATDQPFGDRPKVFRLDHGRALVRFEEGDRDEHVSPLNDRFPTINRWTIEEEYEPTHPADTAVFDDGLAHSRSAVVSHQRGSNWDISPHSSERDSRCDKDPRLRLAKAPRRAQLSRSCLDRVAGIERTVEDAFLRSEHTVAQSSRNTSSVTFIRGGDSV